MAIDLSDRRGVRALAAALAGIALTAAGTSAQPSAGAPIDETQRVTLAGNTRPEAIAKNDLGQVEDGMPLKHMQLLLKRSEKLQRELDAYTDSLANKSSKNYHHWLTAEEFGERFGAATEDIDTVTAWLSAHGFEVNAVYPNRMTIDISGTAGQVREAFGTEIHRYDAGGVGHFANARDPQIPAALARTIAGVVSLHDFRPQPMHKARRQFTFSEGGEVYTVTPADLATIYNLKPAFKAGYTGRGQTIVLIEDTNVYSVADWFDFRRVFGLSTYPYGSFRQTHPTPASGKNNCANPGVNSDGDDIEAILDAEYASAAAPNAAIELASCDNTETTFGGQIALENILNAHGKPPALVSISYGDCEADNGSTANMAFKEMYQQAVNEGVSVFVSAGDEGAASCDAGQMTATHGVAVNAFASTPFNVAVGGTDFADTYLNENAEYWRTANSATDGSAKSYIPEIPWNDSCAGSLIAQFETGSPISYGKKGFCNSTIGVDYLTVGGGSGGPSNCATGAAATIDVASGSCHGWPKPSWQAMKGVPADHVRDIPDVSLFAADGAWNHFFVFCFSDPLNGGSACDQPPAYWAAAGGTSFSSPIMAGIQALVNEKSGGRRGNPNPVYYAIARAEYGTEGNASCNSALGAHAAQSCVFHDVTLGDMVMNCTGGHNCFTDGGANGVLSTSDKGYTPAYKAATGWDFATGIGTINAYNLVMSKEW